MSTAKRLVTTTATILLFVSIVCGQEQNPASSSRSTITVTAAATVDRVRFTAPSTVVQMRIEVYASNGEKLFDNEIRGGNVLDWHLQDGRAERLSDGSYLCVVTTKSLSGRMSQKLGKITIDDAAAGVQPIDTTQLSAQQTQAVGPLEENASLTVLTEGKTQTATVIGHNGEEGQITRGRGALSFRIGDFYSGKDTEQMRLTAEGNLGIGFTHPQAKLDVDGMIRTSQGIIFPDGTIQTSAAGVIGSGIPVGDGGDTKGTPASPGKKKHGKVSTEAVGSIFGEGAANTIAKFNGANSIANSSLFDDGVSIGIGTTAPGGVFDLQRSSGSDILQRMWNTGAGGAKLRYVGAVGATAQLQMTDLNEWLASMAVNNSIGMQFRVRSIGDPNDEGTLAARPRMTIDRNGNVGIGTTAPARRLHVRGPGSQEIGIESSDGGGRQWTVQSSSGGNGGRFEIVDRTASLNRFTILSNGNVGIGTINPGSMLSVAGDINTATKYNIGGIGILSNAGADNVFVGVQAGLSNTTGSRNSFFGKAAGFKNTIGTRNSFFGNFAGALNEIGDHNSFFGDSAGQNTIGSFNSFFGKEAGFSNTEGINNSFFGTKAGEENTVGYDNSFFGTAAGQLSTGNRNSFFGKEAGRNTTGPNNSFFGMTAGLNNSSGSGNSFFGRNAGLSNGDGDNNSFFGSSAGEDNVSGAVNSFFGLNAGQHNISGDENSAFGIFAGSNNTSGNLNTFVGRNAGLSNTIESNNTFIGGLSNGAKGITNSTAIGYQAQVEQSNSLVLGNNANVGIGTTTPNAKLQVTSGDIYVQTQFKGLILRATDNGSCMRVTVNSAGTLVANFMVCP